MGGRPHRSPHRVCGHEGAGSRAPDTGRRRHLGTRRTGLTSDHGGYRCGGGFGWRSVCANQRGDLPQTDGRTQSPPHRSGGQTGARSARLERARHRSPHAVAAVVVLRSGAGSAGRGASRDGDYLVASARRRPRAGSGCGGWDLVGRCDGAVRPTGRLLQCAGEGGDGSRFAAAGEREGDLSGSARRRDSGVRRYPRRELGLRRWGPARHRTCAQRQCLPPLRGRDGLSLPCEGAPPVRAMARFLGVYRRTRRVAYQ